MTTADRFDGIVEQDWNRFRARLAARITVLRPGDRLDLAADGAHGPVRHARITMRREGELVAEVTGGDRIVRPVTSAREVARRVVAVLREAHGVLHPTFLRTDDSTARGALRDRVEQALTRQFGRPVAVDADGDFVVVLDSQVVFVVVADDSPRIRLWAPLLHGIAGRARAAEELLDLNRAWPHIKLVLVEDRLVATVDVLGDPFVPRHLTELFGALQGFFDTVDAHFARRFDGVRYAGGTEPESTLFDEPS